MRIMPALLTFDAPSWFLEAMKLVILSPIAFIFGRLSRQDVSESKLASTVDTVTTMGNSVAKMAEASAARQEQIAALQRGQAELWTEVNKTKDENNRLGREISELRGQIGARR